MQHFPRMIMAGAAACLAITSCRTVRVLPQGNLTMISARNVEGHLAEYTLVKSYVGQSDADLKKEFKKLSKHKKGNTIQEALDATIKNTPGGEFLKNVKLKQVIVRKRKKVSSFWAFEGDVWGIKGEESFQGFKVGDLVQWYGRRHKVMKGKITGLNDSQECMVKPIGKDVSEPIDYSELKKVSE